MGSVDPQREHGTIDAARGFQHRCGGPQPRRQLVAEDLSVAQFQTGLHGVRLHPVDDGLRADTGTGQLSRELGPTRQDGVEVSVRLSGEHSVDGHPQQDHHGAEDGHGGEGDTQPQGDGVQRLCSHVRTPKR